MGDPTPGPPALCAEPGRDRTACEPARPKVLLRLPEPLLLIQRFELSAGCIKFGCNEFARRFEPFVVKSRSQRRFVTVDKRFLVVKFQAAHFVDLSITHSLFGIRNGSYRLRSSTPKKIATTHRGALAVSIAYRVEVALAKQCQP